MMTAKMATSDLLKIMVFGNKGYDVIIPLVMSTAKFNHVIQIVL